MVRSNMSVVVVYVEFALGVPLHTLVPLLTPHCNYNIYIQMIIQELFGHHNRRTVSALEDRGVLFVVVLSEHAACETCSCFFKHFDF